MMRARRARVLLIAAVAFALPVASQGADTFSSRPPGSLGAYKSFGERYRPPPTIDERRSSGRITPRSLPGLEQRDRGKAARREPYPYRYYGDTSRGSYGCHPLGKRAIETGNDNWWNRYRACTEAGGK
jgi:hypothetical protein